MADEAREQMLATKRAENFEISRAFNDKYVQLVKAASTHDHSSLPSCTSRRSHHGLILTFLFSCLSIQTRPFRFVHIAGTVSNQRYYLRTEKA